MQENFPVMPKTSWEMLQLKGWRPFTVRMLVGDERFSEVSLNQESNLNPIPSKAVSTKLGQNPSAPKGPIACEFFCHLKSLQVVFFYVSIAASLARVRIFLRYRGDKSQLVCTSNLGTATRVQQNCVVSADLN